MTGQKAKRRVRFVFICEAAGFVSGLLTREGTRLYAESVTKPFLSPPGIVFPIVWTVLYALMGIGAGLIAASTQSGKRTVGLRLFWAQLVFNFFWSVIFFNMRAYGAALIWLVILWALIFAMIRAWYSVDKTAALLQIPYLVWVTFAGYLNAGVWLLN